MIPTWWLIALFSLMLIIPVAIWAGRRAGLLLWMRRPPIYARQRWWIEYPGPLSRSELESVITPWVWEPPHDRPHDWKSAKADDKVRAYSMRHLDSDPLGAALLVVVVQRADSNDRTVFLLSASDAVPPFKAAIGRHDVAHAIRQLPRGQHLTVHDS